MNPSQDCFAFLAHVTSIAISWLASSNNPPSRFAGMISVSTRSSSE